MNQTDRSMLHLLRCAVRQTLPDTSVCQDADWAEMFKLAQQHKIDALLFGAIFELSDHQPPESILLAWQERTMLTMVGQSYIVEQLFSLLDALDAAGIRAVVLKGVAIKMLYPDPDLRTMSDADLLVSEKVFDAACAVFDSLAYSAVEDEPGVRIYQAPEGLRVELHQKLFDQTAYGFLSKLNEQALFPIESAIKEKVHGGEAYVLPPTKHLLFMLCHMAKHMITTGFGLRQTMDFALFAEANDLTIDWDELFTHTDLLGLTSFASALLWIGVTYLGAPIGVWQKVAKQDMKAVEALLSDLLDAGVFGNSSEERRRSAAVVYRSFDDPSGDHGKLRRALFPSAKSLKAPYLYARHHQMLLPIAWTHRLFRYLWLMVTGKVKHSEAIEGMRIADERLWLLRRLGLRDYKQTGGKTDDIQS